MAKFKSIRNGRTDERAARSVPARKLPAPADVESTCRKCGKAFVAKAKRKNGAIQLSAFCSAECRKAGRIDFKFT